MVLFWWGEIPASVSSQYISALMMVAPYMKEGLLLRLAGKVVSGAYIDMTVRIMRDFGAEVVREGALVRIAPVPYRPVRFRVESGVQPLIFMSYWLLQMAERYSFRDCCLRVCREMPGRLDFGKN